MRAPILTYRKSGSIVGLTFELTVYESGRATYRGPDGSYSGFLRQDIMRELRELSSSLTGGEVRVYPRRGAVDFFYHEACLGGVMIIWVDSWAAEGPIPEEVRILEKLIELSISNLKSRNYRK